MAFSHLCTDIERTRTASNFKESDPLGPRSLSPSHQPDEALAVLLSPGGSLPNTQLCYLRGQVLEALHRPEEALAWYDASEQDFDYFSGAERYSAAVARAHQQLDRR